MKPTQTYWDAQEAFEKGNSPYKKRLAAIFITAPATGAAGF